MAQAESSMRAVLQAAEEDRLMLVAVELRGRVAILACQSTVEAGAVDLVPLAEVYSGLSAPEPDEYRFIGSDGTLTAPTDARPVEVGPGGIKTVTQV